MTTNLHHKITHTTLVNPPQTQLTNIKTHSLRKELYSPSQTKTRIQKATQSPAGLPISLHTPVLIYTYIQYYPDLAKPKARSIDLVLTLSVVVVLVVAIAIAAIPVPPIAPVAAIAVIVAISVAVTIPVITAAHNSRRDRRDISSDSTASIVDDHGRGGGGCLGDDGQP